MEFKGRHFQLTLNEIDKYEKLEDYLLKRKTLTYFISCQEAAPSTGHKHIHIYIHFNNSVSLSLKKLCGAHVEICRGTPKQNIEYIKKDGNIIAEVGNIPQWGGYHNIKEMTLDEVIEHTPQFTRIKKEIDEEEREKQGFFNMLNEIRNDNLKAPKPEEGKTYETSINVKCRILLFKD